MCLPFSPAAQQDTEKRKTEQQHAFDPEKKRSKLWSLECQFILPNMRANDVGRHGVERVGVECVGFATGIVIRQSPYTKHFSPAMGLLSLSHLRTGNCFPLAKETASNIAGAILFDALPRVTQRQLRPSESLLRLPKHS
jgi:hypothetical protein